MGVDANNEQLCLQEEAMLREYYTSSAQSDEFAGLMTPRERQWIVNIQLQQLKVCSVN